MRYLISEHTKREGWSLDHRKVLVDSHYEFFQAVRRIVDYPEKHEFHDEKIRELVREHTRQCQKAAKLFVKKALEQMRHRIEKPLPPLGR